MNRLLIFFLGLASSSMAAPLPFDITAPPLPAATAAVPRPAPGLAVTIGWDGTGDRRAQAYAVYYGGDGTNFSRTQTATNRVTIERVRLHTVLYFYVTSCSADGQAGMQEGLPSMTNVFLVNPFPPRIQLSWPSNAVLIVASTNLTDWETLTNVAGSNLTVETSNWPRRFFRVLKTNQMAWSNAVQIIR